MPVLDGFEVIARIRALERERGGRMPVVALTARSRNEDRVRCLAAGMDEFLVKPIHAQALWASIDRLTARGAPTLIDADALLAACAADPQIFDRVRTSLLEALPVELLAAERWAAEANPRALRESSHRLHGMVSAASSVVAATASELEDLAAEGALDAGRPVLARLARLIPRLVTELAGATLEELERARARPR
jgi:CheY-like chemotaxis protein